MASAPAGVSDPQSPDYDPHSPFYDVTADPSSKYYVGPLASGGRSGDELRAEAAAEVDDEIAHGWLGQAVDPVVKDHRIQDLYQQHLDDARHGLDNGLEIRETGGAPKTLWANATHEQMFTAIAQNANSGTMAETSEEWVSVGNELATHQETLARAISSSLGNWQGDAGDAVREHLAGVGKWLGATAQGATLTGRQQQIHSQTLNETQKAMAANPPVAFSVQDANARLQQVTDPVQYAAQASQDMAQYRAQQAAREHAAQIMTQFDETIGAAVATPRFPPPPKLPGSTAGGGASGGGAAQPLLARTARTPMTPSMPGSDPSTVDGVKARGLDTGAGPTGGAPGIPDSSGGPGSGSTPPPLNIPDSTTGDGLAPGSHSGTGAPGTTMPRFDDSTTTSGFAPAASNPPGGMPGLNIPDIPGGGQVRGGQGPGGGFTPQPFTMPGDIPGGGPLPGGGGRPGGPLPGGGSSTVARRPSAGWAGSTAKASPAGSAAVSAVAGPAAPVPRASAPGRRAASPAVPRPGRRPRKPRRWRPATRRRPGPAARRARRG